MRKFLFNYSLYSHPEIENFRVRHEADEVILYRDFLTCRLSVRW
jgi:hypothetical protein